MATEQFLQKKEFERPATGAHWPALDGLRGLAILLVIPHNADTFDHPERWLMFPVALVHAGWIGVQLFFALSGFLITRNLIGSRNAEHYYRSFYARRALRILPLFYLTLIAFLVVLPHLVAIPAAILDTYSNQVWFWTFLCNWAQAWGYSVYWFPHFWSLAIEEQFYLVWPFVVAVCAPRRLVLICAALIGAAIVIRSAMLLFGSSPEAIYRVTFCRMDALAAGAIVAALAHDEPLALRVRDRYVLFAYGTGGTFVLLAMLSHGFAPSAAITITIGYSVLAIGAAVLLYFLVMDGEGWLPSALQKLLSVRWLRSVGKYSYAMYIFHLPLFILARDSLETAFRPAGQIAPVLVGISVAVLSYALAFISYYAFERYFLRLRSSFPASAIRSDVAS